MAREIIDAESGKPIDPYAAAAAEKTIAGWAYPAIVPNKIRRVLAHKLVEINRIAYANQREIEAIFISEAETFEIAKLPAPIRRDLLKLRDINAQAKVLQKKLLDVHRVVDYYVGETATTVRVYRDQATIDAERDAKKARHFKAKADHDSAIEDFKVLLGDVVAEELAKVRKKVNPDLIARLDAIGPDRQLLPKNPEHPKTANQLMVDQVLAGTLDPQDALRQQIYATQGITVPIEDIVDLDARQVEREKRDMERRDRKIARESKSQQRRKTAQQIVRNRKTHS